MPMTKTAAPKVITKTAFTKRIGHTTYRVSVYFSDTSRETMDEKIIRIIQNESVHKIAKIFIAEKIERPTYYQYTRGIVNTANYDHSDPYAWQDGTIKGIIAKPEYMGHTVNFRSYKDSYKDKNQKLYPKENWVIFEDTHPAIIDRETWETAQRRRKTVRRTDHGEANPLTGLLFCADCGAKMYNHRVPSRKLDAYDCSTYKITGRLHSAKCSSHHISTKVLRQLVLNAIKTASDYARTNQSEFIKKVREASNIQQDEAAKGHKKRIVKEQKRVAELHTLIRRIYEDNVSGKLTDKRFELMMAEYEQEQADLEKSIVKLQAELDSFNADGARTDSFLKLIRKYTDFTELTPTMIGEFIEKIIVHESDRSSGEREQNVDIYLNFIGKFDVPLPEPSPEEIAVEEQARLDRARRREYQRRHKEKKKQKKQDTLNNQTSREQ